MRPAGLLLSLMVLLGCASAPPAAEPESARRAAPPDLILAGGRVFTGDDARPWAEAVAIHGERIAAVGSNAEIRALAAPSTRVVELGGRLVIPGINDAHMHVPLALGAMTMIPIPPDIATRDAFLGALRAAVPIAPAGALLGAELPLPLTDIPLTRDDLDAISTAHRIRVHIFGGHGAVLNTAALRDWGIADDATDPPGGFYGRDGGRLNGWLYEHAYWVPHHREMEAASDEELRTNIREFESYMLRQGVTSIQTMPFLPPERIAAILESLPARMRWRIIETRLAPLDVSPGRRPVKYLLDGTPIERNAALREPWSDLPGSRGRLAYSLAEIDAIVRDAARGERQVLLHATGDAAVDAVLDAMRRTPADWPARRVRIEHGDMIAPEHFALARALGVAIVQNPSHFMIRDLGLARFGAERLSRFQPARSLLEAGVPFALGSDGPPEPFLNIFFATVHAVNPAEALTVEQALRAYTRGAAWAEFEEERKGTIAPGMLADVAVLSQDIFAVPPPQLPDTRSVMTIVGGKVVWEGAE